MKLQNITSLVREHAAPGWITVPFIWCHDVNTVCFLLPPPGAQHQAQ